jgi:hypothetical protein
MMQQDRLKRRQTVQRHFTEETFFDRAFVYIFTDYSRVLT